MSGALSALVSHGAQHYQVTLENGLFNNETGFATSGGSFGSIIPHQLWRAGTIVRLFSDDLFDFEVNISEVFPQDGWNRLIVQDGSGALRAFDSSSATFTVVSGTFSRWRFGVGSNRLWQTADSGEVKLLTMF